MGTLNNRDRLNKISDVGFYITMCFASIAIGFGMLGLISKIILLWAE
jgi:hypothetical protein